MDGRRFDELSRVFAGTGSRRGLFQGAIAALGALGLRAGDSRANQSDPGCLPFGEKCRPRRGAGCCSGYCSDRYRCTCPPDDPTCDRPQPPTTAQPNAFAVAADPICSPTCLAPTRCLSGDCCPEDRIYVECQAADICQPDESLRCCVGPEAGPERCCPLNLICGDICCRDDQICEEGSCIGGVQYAGGVWLRRP